jgi:hypothetical protein
MSARLIPTIVAVLTVVGVAAVATAPTGAAVPPPPTVTPSLAPVPADAISVHDALLDSIACGAPGSCVAGGKYVDSGSHQQGLIDTLSSGHWTAVKAPLPGDADPTSPNAQVIKVACGAAGSCVAYASYQSTSSPFSGRALLSLSGGHWSVTALPATLAIKPGSVPTLNGAACNAANSCTVVGNYTGTDFLPRAFVAFFHTTWSVIEAPLPVDKADPASSSSVLAALNDVSCSSTRCFGVGDYLTSNGTYQVLVDSITPSTPTANAAALPPLPAGDDHGTNLKAISCESSGPCAAYGTYADSSNGSHMLIEPLGSNWVHSWAPLEPPLPSGGTGPVLTAIACVHGSSDDGCVLAGNYTDASVHEQALSDRLSGGTWLMDTPPSSRTMGAASCGSPSFCLEAVVETSGVDDLAVLSGTTCDSAYSCYTVGSNNGPDGVIEHVVSGSAPPSVTLTTPSKPFSAASSTKLSWTGTAGGAVITHFRVQEKKAAWNGNFGSWATPSAWSNLSAATTHVTAGLSVGMDSCFRVEAFDSAGHSAFSSQRCTAMPLDDKSLTASSGWSRVSATGYYRGTYSSNMHLNAMLTRTGAEFDRVALIATECPTCGKVGIYSGSTQLSTVDLHAATTKHQALVTLTKVSQRTATLTIKVLTSGKTIQIDGLGVSRS